MTTPLQRAFVQEYPIDLNATQAAIRAGYSERTANRQASDLLSKPVIQRAIQKALEKRAKRAELSQDRVLKEIRILALSNIADYITIATDGSIQVKCIEDMPPEASRAIQSIKEKRRILSGGKGDGEEIILESTLEIKLWDKGKALDQLARHLSLYADKEEKGAFMDLIGQTYGLDDKQLDKLNTIADKRLKAINVVMP